jgi:hypothetical protein
MVLYDGGDNAAHSLPEETPKRHVLKRLLSYLSRVETKPFEDREATQQMSLDDLGFGPEPQPRDPAEFAPGTGLLLCIDDVEIVIDDPDHDIWLGRFNDKMPPPRDAYIVNLTDLEGYKRGVSRLHAVIHVTDDWRLELVDLASSNGTYLNGRSLVPHQAYALQDGDEIRLGQLPIMLYFMYP